ncbi:uncharacterized protein At1g76070 [Diospyros lotus]|uniref:uncharacterized protein At1g76070 n=1 Tax=Diospyros lotus TaxID=55363 RepID=UPI002258F1E2|nr:uncharacterized protein At1g76070 [Diospyros lotus]
MEKPASKAKNKFLKLLPKAVAAVNFQNHPFSPTRDKRQDHVANRLKTHFGKGFSGPIISIIPAEARRKPKNSGFEAQEPTSPKVSCMGQIKHKKKKKIKKDKHVPLPKDCKPVDSKKKLMKFPSFFAGGKPPAARTKSVPSGDNSASLSDNRAPPLGQMRRFASGRESLGGFDWTAQVAPEEGDHRESSSDEESEGEEREVIIPFSAPILIGGPGPCSGAGDGVALEPRKEINLWKRRTMAQPRPLQLRH